MININIGGTKGNKKYSEVIRRNWKIMDASPGAEYEYDLNSGKVISMDDAFVDNYYTSHTLEHVNTFRIPFVLSEIFRTLKPKGKIRIVVPNIRIGMQLYLNGAGIRNKKYCTPDPGLPKTDLGYFMGWGQGRDRGKNQYYSGHRTIFDLETLDLYLRQAGFRYIYDLAYNVCSSVFKGLDFSRYEGWSLFMEAEKSV